MLTNDEVDKVRLTLSTAGWNEIMRPRIENKVRSYIKLLILHPSERQEKDRDDAALRVRIEELEWLLTAFQNEITVNLHNRQGDELARQGQMDGTEEFGSVTPANP